MLNQTAATVNPAPVHSLNLAGTPDRVAFIFAKTRRKIDDLLTVAPNLEREHLENNALELVKIARVAFCQNQSNDDAARALSLVESALDSLNNNAAPVETLETLGADLAALVNAEPTTTEPAETTETTEPETKTVEPEPGAVLELSPISDAEKKDIRDFIARFRAIGRARKDVFGRLYRTLDELRRFCRANHIRRGVFVDRPFKPSKIRLIDSDWENMQEISADKIDDPRDYSRRIAKLLENTLTTYYNHVFTVVKSAPVAVQEPAQKYRAAQANARALADLNAEGLNGCLFVTDIPAVTSQPDPAILAASSAFGAVGTYAAPLMIGQDTQQDAPAETIDDVLTDEEKALLSSIDWDKGDSVPALLLRSINDKNPVWVKPWFSYSSTQRKYFDGSRYSIGNLLRLMLQGANADFYVSRTEARRILGKDAAPKQGARAYKVIKPRIWGAKNLTKNDLDALRRREYVPLEMKSDEEMNDLERKHAGKIRFETEPVYHQGAFEGLPLKHTEPLYRNDNERNALADKVLADFCAANNITLCIMPGVNRACCSFVIDDDDAPITITAPTIEDHKSAADYYSTLFHEALHAANRRNHCQLTKKREELSAEIGSCIVLNTLGFNSSEYIDNSAAYVKSWKDVANEKNAIVKAWKYAEKSANLILASFFDMQRAAIKTDATENILTAGRLTTSPQRVLTCFK